MNTVENAHDTRLAELSAVVRHALTEGAGTLEHLQEALRQCAESLRLGDPGGTATDLREVIGHLVILSEFIDQVRKGLRALQVDGTPFEAWSRSVDVFQQMVSAMESRDWVTLSDLIEYELHPRLDETRHEMLALTARLPS